MPNRDTTAARALLAHYNTSLAGRLARAVLKASPAAQSRMADAIFDAIDTNHEALYALVATRVSAIVGAYVATSAFAARVDKVTAANVERWIGDMIATALRDKVAGAVQAAVRAAAVDNGVLRGRYLAAVEAEVARLAVVRAADIAAQGKVQ